MRNEQETNFKEKAILAPMTDADWQFREALASMISKYEQETGNRVSANILVSLTGEHDGRYAPLAYCRDVKLHDGNNVDKEQPFMVGAMDTHPDLCILPADEVSIDIAKTAIRDQIRQYSDSDAGPFLVRGGHAMYHKDVLKEVLQGIETDMIIKSSQEDLPDVLERLFRALGVQCIDIERALKN